MKKSMFTVFAVLAVTGSFAFADQAPINPHKEARSRTVGEPQLMGVSKCSVPRPTVDDVNFQVGTLPPNRDGVAQPIMSPGYRITGTASLSTASCVHYQDYTADVSGHWWNQKESEVPNTATARNQSTTNDENFTADYPSEEKPYLDNFEVAHAPDQEKMAYDMNQQHEAAWRKCEARRKELQAQLDASGPVSCN